MNDPSYGISKSLLPHVHLISTYKFPSLPRFNNDAMVENLLRAPHITKEVAPMNWMFLDGPHDGSVLLVWQPLAQLGTKFASDGYVYADAEEVFMHQHRGYTIEAFVQRSGFKPTDTHATHSRRRYRIVRSDNATPNQPPVDPSLWIVHYARSDPQNQFPITRIPIRPDTRTILRQRSNLRERGQLIRKEFMLGDRNSWPTIKDLPGKKVTRTSQPMSSYPGNVIQHMNRTQQQAHLQSQYSSNPRAGPSAAKRPRHLPPNQQPVTSTATVAMAIAQDSSLDEDEDTLKGDTMDTLTARDISVMRYIQHHEWLEEVFSSPFATGQIVPVELGLGRAGELESLTRDFFVAPTGKTPMTEDADNSDEAVNPKFKMLDPAKRDDFMRRALEKIADLNAEMENMKSMHARNMAKLSQGQGIREAEKRLRSLVAVPATEGSIWETNPQHPDAANNDLAIAVLRQQDRVNDIAREVEAALNQKIEVMHPFKCVQRGGLEEKAPQEENPLIEDPVTTDDQPMLDDDMASFPEFDDKADWMQDDIIPEQIPPTGPEDATPQQETSNEETPDHPADPEPANQSDSGDWVMVDPPATDLPVLAAAATATDIHRTTTTTNTSTPAASNLPNDHLPDFGTDVPELQGEAFEPGEFDQAVDFGDLDPAGDVLAAFDTPANALGNDGDISLALEDSAFGDAFHHDGVGGEDGVDVEMGVDEEVRVADDAVAGGEIG